MFNKKTGSLFSQTRGVIIFLSLFFCLSGCGLDEISTNPDQLYVKVTTAPPSCKVVLRSMNSSRISSYTSPIEIGYILRPFMASYIEVSKGGYKTKIIRLDPAKKELLIKLDQLTEEEINHVKYSATSTMGPGSHGEIGGGGSPSSGGMGMNAQGVPKSVPNRGMGGGMGGFAEFGM